MNQNPLPILVSYQLPTVFAAVPKRRGRGYLKVPAGHHQERWLSEAEEISGCSISGLDGYLAFEVQTPEHGRDVFSRVEHHLVREFGASGVIESPLSQVLCASDRRLPNT